MTSSSTKPYCQLNRASEPHMNSPVFLSNFSPLSHQSSPQKVHPRPLKVRLNYHAGGSSRISLASKTCVSYASLSPPPPNDYYLYSLCPHIIDTKLTTSNHMRTDQSVSVAAVCSEFIFLLQGCVLRKRIMLLSQWQDQQRVSAINKKETSELVA